MKKVLIPIELTYLSKCALELGTQLAKKAKAKIEVVAEIETLDDEKSFTSSGEVIANNEASVYNFELKKAVKRRIDQRYQEIIEWVPDLKVEPKIIYGLMPHVLVEEVKKVKPDLVLLGGDRLDLSDDTANLFLRHAIAPSLLLKCSLTQIEDYQDIVFLPNDSDSEDLISHLKALKALFQAKIHLLRIIRPNHFETSDEAENWLKNYQKKHDLDGTVHVFNDQSEEDGLVHFSDRFEHAIVASGLHKRNFRDWLVGEYPEGQIVVGSQHPVWLFKG